MSLRVVFRPAAKSEYEEAAAWYETQSPGLGEEFLREMDDVISSAAEFPARYPMVTGDVRRAVARRFPYSVFFRCRADTLVVLAVFHGRRDPAVWRRRT
jgi:plasmid stabilization system protein ParE